VRKSNQEGSNDRPHRGGWACIVGGIVGLSAICGPMLPKSASAETPLPIQKTVTVLVFNYSQASERTLTEAEHQAGLILAAAGFDTTWLNCPIHPTPNADPACNSDNSSGQIRLRVLNRINRDFLRDSVFGFTIAPIFVSVSYESALRMAHSDNSDSETPVILGCVVAHETGHLLLGPNAHSASGIMQARWDRATLDRAMKGSLRFTPEQAKIIRLQGTAMGLNGRPLPQAPSLASQK